MKTDITGLTSINLMERAELVHGAIHISHGDDGYSIQRMTRELDKFYNYSEAAEIRARCLSGVRICFHTNSGFIGLRLKYGRAARPVSAVDIVIDSRESLTFCPADCKKIFSIAMDLEPGEHKIEIYLPHLCECIVKELTVEENAWVNPVNYNGGRLLFIGDSITQGMDASSPTRSFASRVAAACKLDFHNLGVGGAVMEKEVGRLALKLSWRKAVVAFGVNDCSKKRPIEEFIAHTRGMFEILSASSHARVFVVTPIPWLAAPADANLQMYRDAIKETAAAFRRVKVIDGLEMVPADPSYFTDKTHPNDLGMKIYAENLTRSLIAE